MVIQDNCNEYVFHMIYKELLHFIDISIHLYISDNLFSRNIFSNYITPIMKNLLENINYKYF